MTELNLSTKAADQDIAELIARADGLGLVPAARCRHCGAPLWAAASLTAGAGPICRRRHDNGVGILDQDSPDAA